ncbi:MAG: acetylxylan esterase, partial [Flavitalea sp.]
MTFSPAAFAQPVTPGDPPAGEKENLDVFQQWIKWNNPGSSLIQYLNCQASTLYDARDKEIAQIKTKQQWLNRQQLVKEKLLSLLGPLPQKTPLNAKITGIIKRKGYRIEKLVYEAFPGYYVTGCLYIPDKLRGKAPAILNVMGHDQEGYKVELYQIIITNLVSKGMIVLAIDPPGQGEHVQYFDSSINFSSIGYTVIEHCYFGNQNFLAGTSPARYFTWEGIRAIDYLLSRKDVDAERIGVTGFSGGGTVTSYISAIDERVKVSVPCSWSTASKRELETKGAQDAETVFIGGMAKGISFEDLLEVRAPKPTLMNFVSRDQYLSMQGAREALREARNCYKAFDKEDNIDLVEDDSKHWMTASIRLAIYTFFMKHFGISGSPAEIPTDLLSEEEMKALKVTSTGQISTSLGGDMIFDVNRKEAEKLTARLDSARKDIDHHLTALKDRAIALSGYIAPGDAGEGFINGRYQRKGYAVSKYAINGSGNYAIPFLLFTPSGMEGQRPTIVYIHAKGKEAEAYPGGEIEKLVNKGYIVAAVDVLGIGEVKNTAARGNSDGYTALLIGRSIPAVQAADIISVVNYLKTRPYVNPQKIGAMAIGDMGIPLLHAAAFDSSISAILLKGSLISYRSAVNTRLYNMGITK